MAAEPQQTVPLLRLLGTGSGATMPSQWRDPDVTMASSAREARTVTGRRVLCQLRRLAGSPCNGISAEHILAGDKLVELSDIARLGFTPKSRAAFVFTSHSAGPSSGPSPAERARERAIRELRRALNLFSDIQVQMLRVVVVEHQSVRCWTLQRTAATGLRHDQAIERGKLAATMDVLVRHFENAIDNEVASGRRRPLS